MSRELFLGQQEPSGSSLLPRWGRHRCTSADVRSARTELAVASGAGDATGVSTPFILGDTREAPRYGQVFVAEASPKRHAAYREYCNDVEESNQSQVLHQDLMTPLQLIPLNIRRVLARRHAVGKMLDNGYLLREMQEHLDTPVGREDLSRNLANEVVKGATMRPGGG